MAGMLPGVECARRRRVHQGGSNDQQNRTRRFSFCLYTSNHDTHLNTNSLLRRTQSFQSENLGDVAREAKERLDERLKIQRKSEITGHKSKGNIKSKNENVHDSLAPAIFSYLQREVFDPKKKISKRFSWARLGWKASDQIECAVCLEWFKSGDILVHLPCAHRFHSMCLVPWLESNAHCPCCRTQIFS
ncbi:probable E3 ubiquitin-protein ligase RHY1A [Magnolia sinica]|uniref:probable E3 ubiquitin-protein ligase RHY1A n=1 Tax=Magnolia sinica TaxID=86752 RepID=UPI00265A5426|nr:probable E3 ubiquitin-protein ligase RHY1A [Magnolia sinica]